LGESVEFKFSWDTLERRWEDDTPKTKYLFVVWDEVYSIKHKFEFIF
jgi:hypothetical protein